MKPVSIASGLICLLAIALPCEAMHVEASVGILYKPLNPESFGVEAEAGPVGSWWSLGGLYQAERFERQTGTSEYGYAWNNPTHGTVWGRLKHELPNGDMMAGLIGASYHPRTSEIGGVIAEPWQFVGPLLGVSYTLNSGRLWLRVTPHMVLSADSPFDGMSWLVKSGIPWVDAGVELFPGVELSFRLAMTFLKLTWLIGPATRQSAMPSSKSTRPPSEENNHSWASDF